MGRKSNNINIMMAVVAVFAFVNWTGPAWASDSPSLVFSFKIPVEVEAEYLFAASDPHDEYTAVFTTIEPELSFHISDMFSIEAAFVLEPVGEGAHGEDQYFEDHGLYVEQLFATVSFDRIELSFGKVNPAFSLAYDVAPGIYGVNVGEEYEVTERIGVGAAIALDREGDNTLTATAFFADTTVLSDSAMTSRGRTHLDDGSVSNTEDLSSFAVSLDGTNFILAPNLQYSIGYIHQAGSPGLKDEQGVVVGLTTDYEFENGVVFSPLLEYAHFDNIEGSEDDRNFLTIGGGLAQGPWSASLTFGQIETEHDGESAHKDRLTQLTGGYTFKNDLTIELAYAIEEGEHSDVSIFGLRLSRILYSQLS